MPSNQCSGGMLHFHYLEAFGAQRLDNNETNQFPAVAAEAFS
jgi:hypothetical protein